MASSDAGNAEVEILQEEVDEDYEPTDKEIREYAEWLGIDAVADADLLWIARRGLMTPLPKPWRPCQSGDGEIFYFNSDSGENTWDHPCDAELRALYASEREKKASGAVAQVEGDEGGEQKADSPLALASTASDASPSIASPEPPSAPPPTSQRAPPALPPQPPGVNCAAAAALLGSLPPLVPPPPHVGISGPQATGSVPDVHPVNKPPQPAADLDDLFDMPLELGATADVVDKASSERGQGTKDSAPASPLSPITSAAGGEDWSPIAATSESPSPRQAATGQDINELSPIATAASSSSSAMAPSVKRAVPFSAPVPPKPPLAAPPKQNRTEPPALPVAASGWSAPPIDDEQAGVTARLCRELEQLRSTLEKEKARHKAEKEIEKARNTASLSALSEELANEAAENRRFRAERVASEDSVNSLRADSAARLAAQAQQTAELLSSADAELAAVKAQLTQSEAKAAANAADAAANAAAAEAAARQAEATEAAAKLAARTQPAPIQEELLSSDALSPPTPELVNILVAELRPAAAAEKTPTPSPAAQPSLVPSLWAQLEEDVTGNSSKEKAMDSSPGRQCPSSSLDVSSMSAVVLDSSPMCSPFADALFHDPACSPLAGPGIAEGSPAHDEWLKGLARGAAAISATQKTYRGRREPEAKTEPPGSKAAASMKAKLIETSHEHDHCAQEELRTLRAELGLLRAELQKDRATEKTQPMSTSTEEQQQKHRAQQAEAEANSLAATARRWSEPRCVQQGVQVLAPTQCATQPSAALEATLERVSEAAPWGADNDAKAKLVRTAEERSLRAHRETRDTRNRLETAEAELERLSWELQQWREDADDNDRILRDTRSALHKEQASQVSAKASVRDSQREVHRISSQLKSQEAEGELAACEVQLARSELADQEAEKQRLQLQLQARDVELGQLRRRHKSVAQSKDYELRAERLAFAERELVLGGRERYLEERENLTAEAEAMLQQQRHHLRSELQRAELAGLRATVSELSTPLHMQQQQQQQQQLAARGHNVFAATGNGERFWSSAGSHKVRMDAAWPICSSDESFVPKEIGRRLDGDKVDLEAPTPSSSSATSPTGPPALSGCDIAHGVEQRDLAQAEKADVPKTCHVALKANLANASAPTSRTLERRSAPGATAAAAAGELPDYLRSWRKELRHEHAALEEDRRLWRGEARRVKRQSELGDGGNYGSAAADILAELRKTLDARAGALNASIGEYRALEKLHSSGPLRRSSSQRARSGGASRGAVGSRRRASSTAALGTAPVADALGGLTASMKCASHEEDLLRRWQHVLTSQQGSLLSGTTAHSRRSSSSCRTMPPLSSRTSYLNLQFESASALRAGAGGA